jgi:hypothetical protein
MTSPKENPLRYMPPFILFLFLLHLGYVLGQPDRMLMDPGTGWQLKIGQILWQTGQLPMHDPFSYTVPGQDWILYQWLFQFVSGFFQMLGGIPLVTAVCALILGWTLLLLMQRMLEQGAQILCALGMVFVVWLVMTMHIQARPHVVTYLFFCLFLLQLERAYRSEGGWRHGISYLVPLPCFMVLWANMHGGFMAGLILCGIFGIGSFLDACSKPNVGMWWRFVVFGGCTAACCWTSMLNPYGTGLHQAILGYLNLESLKYWDEFTTPFIHESLNVDLFKGTFLVLFVLLARLRAKLDWAEVGCLIFFLYHALSSVRHVILFMLVAAPIVARLATQGMEERWPVLAKRLQVITEKQAGKGITLVYAVTFSVLFLSLVWLTPGFFRQNLDDLRLSKQSVEFIEKNQDRFQHLFNTEDLGGALIYRLGPKLQVFMDDRTDLYRDDFILGTYLPILRMEEGWYGKLESLGVTSAVLPQKSRLGGELQMRGWKQVHEDHLNTLYLKP